LSNEAYELLLASHGAASAFRNANAYDAIATLLLEARPGQAYYRFAEGFSALAGALLAACGPNLSLRASHRLAAVQTSSEGLTLRFETAEGPRVVEARRVILALPKRALEGVAFDAALVGDQFGADLASVTPVAASKLYLEFDRVAEADAWSGAEEHIAASYTDMPMRQCYHFSSSDPASPDGRLLMASFADDAATSFWSELARDADVDDFSATQEMIDAAHAQLSLLFPGQNLPKPARGFFVDWSQARRGGAWHAWVPGVRGWEVRERIRQPNSNVPLFICGEAFSQLQGWTEGAINNAEMMLERHFGLSRPIWVRGDYAFEF
jgi:monoamine oxidase